MMLIDVDMVNYLNNTAITESVSSELNSLLGWLFLSLGIIFLYATIVRYKKQNRKLRKW